MYPGRCVATKPIVVSALLTASARGLARRAGSRGSRPARVAMPKVHAPTIIGPNPSMAKKIVRSTRCPVPPPAAAIIAMPNHRPTKAPTMKLAIAPAMLVETAATHQQAELAHLARLELRDVAGSDICRSTIHVDCYSQRHP